MPALGTPRNEASDAQPGVRERAAGPAAGGAPAAGDGGGALLVSECCVGFDWQNVPKMAKKKNPENDC